jgi:hypothetical protein
MQAYFVVILLLYGEISEKYFKIEHDNFQNPSSSFTNRPANLTSKTHHNLETQIRCYINQSIDRSSTPCSLELLAILVMYTGMNHNGILQCEPGNLLDVQPRARKEPTANEKVRRNFESNTFQDSGGTSRPLAETRCPRPVAKLHWNVAVSLALEDTSAYIYIVHTYTGTSYLCNRPWRPIGLWHVAPTFSRQLAHRWRWGCQPYAPAVLYPQGDSWYSFILTTEWNAGP